MIVEIRPLKLGDKSKLLQLIDAFRKSLAELRGSEQKTDLRAASQELDEYQRKNYPIYVAEDETGGLVGYLVCRVEGDVIWAESLYVVPEQRRMGIGSALYAEAEHLAEQLGCDTVYNWIDPNNNTIIQFLGKRGYNVLNLVELRRTYPGEGKMESISVGLNQFYRHGDRKSDKP